MIKVKSRADLYPVPKPAEPVKAPEPKPEISEGLNAALEFLARQARATSIAIQALTETQKETGQRLVALAGERKPPIRLDADIVRDKAGKMTRVIITPIHK